MKMTPALTWEPKLDGSTPAMGRRFRYGGRLVALVVAGLAAALAGAPSCAQVYKWVDEDGVTHYSDRVPANQGTLKKVDIVPDRLSVYTPDPSLTTTPGQERDSTLSDRIDRLEQELQAERRARQFAAAAEAQAFAAAYEQCLADRRVDCDGYDGYYFDGVPIVVAAAGHRHSPHRGIPRVPRHLAGNIVGTSAIMLGNLRGGNAVPAGMQLGPSSRMTGPSPRWSPPGS